MYTGPKNTEVVAALDKAVQSFKQGRFEAARKICAGVLAKDPDNIRALNVLGGCLTNTGSYDQAIKVVEKLCSLSPGNAAFYNNLSYLYSVKGHALRAILAMAYAISSDTKNPVYQAKFAQMIDQLQFHQATTETNIIKNAIQVCMGNRGIDIGAFSAAWHSLLLLEPAFIKFAALTENGEFEEQAEAVKINELAKPLADPYVLLGLKSLHAIDAKFERIMTFFRHFFLSRFDDYDAEPFLPFLCALAEHCNLNEYVYGCTKKELEMADALEAQLDLSAKPDARAMARVALVSCYRDLMQAEYAGDIARASEDSQNDAFKLLVKNTITIPAKTSKYLDTIAAISPADDSAKNVVSSRVAKQYEENPYPRWRHLDTPVLSGEQKAKGRGRTILIAGCGTGYEALNTAVHYPEARIWGVDLSVPSLAYGKQKADELGVNNIEFLQGDILELENLGQHFDLISCSGVLHHMEDPVEGWKKLLACLKPDGLMKIALYSEAARQSVVLCRNWIEEQGFAPTPEGIREFRQAIMNLDAANPLTEIMSWTDFFSMSMCRDLVFNVQEHRVTLPWIKSVLDDLGLSCLSMRISNPNYRKEYLSMYPGDRGIKNLEHLHEYETRNPNTFRDMYSFWCCRKASAAVKSTPDWYYTASQ